LDALKAEIHVWVRCVVLCLLATGESTPRGADLTRPSVHEQFRDISKVVSLGEELVIYVREYMLASVIGKARAFWD